MAGECADRGARERGEGRSPVDPFHTFFLRHRFCGELATGIDQGAAEPVIIWISCSCGRRVEETATRKRANDNPDEPVEEVASLDAFYLEHRECGELITGEERVGGRAMVWTSCSCGARIARPTDVNRPAR